MQKVKENLLISPFLVFYVITSMQVGVGALGFQRIIAKVAGYDSWIAIILATVFAHVIVWIIYRILQKQDGDIIAVHRNTFGKWIGGFFSLLFILYVTAMCIVVIRSYIEVIQVWMFPDFNNILFATYILLLAYYIISGGFRTVVGICFFSVTLTAYLFLTMIYPLEYANFRNFLPILDHSWKELAIATKDMSLTVLGFELLFMFYPFLKDPKKSLKWAQLGIAYTMITYLIYGITAMAFYSETQLEKQIWATLAMWKVVELPFVERFEYIGIATWLLVILPNVCLTLWAASRGIKRLFPIKQKTSLIGLMGVVLIMVGVFQTRVQINMLSDIMAKVGFYFNFVYVPFLFVVTIVLAKMRGTK